MKFTKWPHYPTLAEARVNNGLILLLVVVGVLFGGWQFSFGETLFESITGFGAAGGRTISSGSQGSVGTRLEVLYAAAHRWLCWDLYL